MNESKGTGKSELDESLAIPAKSLEFLESIGQGGFGEVFKGTWFHTRVRKETVAIKRLLVKDFSETVIADFKNEVTLHVELDSPNVVKLWGITVEQPYCMVMEYMSNGSLYHYLQRTPQKALSWQRRKDIGRNIAEGLTYLHGRTQPIIHGDLKSLNVLLNEDFIAKIADFGLSQMKIESTSKLNSTAVKVNSAGSFLWKAPELFKRGAKKTWASDVYALGWTLWEIASHEIPFYEESDKGSEVIMRFIEMGDREEFPEGTPEGYRDVAQACWAGDKEERPAASEVVLRMKEFAESSAIKLPLPSSPLLSKSPVQEASKVPVHPNYQLNSDAPVKIKKALPTTPPKKSPAPQPNYLLESESPTKGATVKSPRYMLNSQQTSSNGGLSFLQQPAPRPPSVERPNYMLESQMAPGMTSPAKSKPSDQSIAGSNNSQFFSPKLTSVPVPKPRGSISAEPSKEEIPGKKEFSIAENYLTNRVYNTSLSLYIKSASKGYSPAYVRLAQLYIKHLINCSEKAQEWLAKIQKSMSWLHKQAEAGNEDAQIALADIYMDELGCERDAVKAFNWYKKAGMQGNANAQYVLGLCYEDGKMGTKQNVQQAFDWYKKSAENGNANGQYRLGICYQTGIGSEKNEGQALAWYQKAAEQGHILSKDILEKYSNEKKQKQDEFEKLQREAEQGDVQAQYYLGWHYDDGLSPTKKDKLLAFHWYEKAAQNGHTAAQLSLGLFFQEGIGTNKDEQQAFLWYEKAAREESSACYYLGMCYEKGTGTAKDEYQAFYWYQKGAEENEGLSAYKLGCLYEDGRGIEKNVMQAFYWYHFSAHRDGPPEALCKLGLCYETGIGTKKDEEQALKWLQKAAEQGETTALRAIENLRKIKSEQKAFEHYQRSAIQGDTRAQYKLACFYENGIVVEKDLQKAILWFKKAAEQNNSAAQYKLGHYLLQETPYRNKTEAITWLEKAAKQGIAAAQYELGCLYEGNSSTNQNIQQVFFWFHKAAEQGHPLAQYKVGCCFKDGDGTPRDDQKAFTWFQKAAEHGVLSAQYKLGCCYQNGHGTNKDDHKAFQWYQKAATGVEYLPSARYNLGCCYENGIGITKDYSKAEYWYKEALKQGDIRAQEALKTLGFRRIGSDESSSSKGTPTFASPQRSHALNAAPILPLTISVIAGPLHSNAPSQQQPQSLEGSIQADPTIEL